MPLSTDGVNELCRARAARAAGRSFLRVLDQQQRLRREVVLDTLER